jgi:hypothetical protein
MEDLNDIMENIYIYVVHDGTIQEELTLERKY